MNFYNQIQNGYFGSTQPMPQQGVYMNQYNYPNYNQYYQPQQPVYQPVQYQSPFGGNYNNPYAGQTFGYNQFGQYQPNQFQSPTYMQKEIDNQKKLFELSARLCAAYRGKEINEERLRERLYPSVRQQNLPQKSHKEMMEDRDWNDTIQMMRIADDPNTYYRTRSYSCMVMFNEQLRAEAEEFKGHNLVQFLNDDLWKLEREAWIRKNINRGQDRNLSTTYNSREYNELLNMHNSGNPILNVLMDEDKYDNNGSKYTAEIGVTPMGSHISINKETGRLAFKRPPLPGYTDEEIAEKRRQWTEYCQHAVRRKDGLDSGGGDANV